jgi:hypothetical protein
VRGQLEGSPILDRYSSGGFNAAAHLRYEF